MKSIDWQGQKYQVAEQLLHCKKHVLIFFVFCTRRKIHVFCIKQQCFYNLIFIQFSMIKIRFHHRIFFFAS